jgi:hypothetical protein
VEVGLGDLDVVPEIIREPDLQAADAGAFLLGALKVGQPVAVAAREPAQAVELGIETCADEVPVVQVGRELVGQRGSWI